MPVKSVHAFAANAPVDWGYDSPARPTVSQTSHVAARERSRSKRKDRNAEVSVDPFHMPAELADGLGVESLLRPEVLPRSDPTSPSPFGPTRWSTHLYRCAPVVGPAITHGPSDCAMRRFLRTAWVLHASPEKGGFGDQVGGDCRDTP